MQTDLQIVEHEIKPGRVIQCNRLELDNFRVHMCLQSLSTLMMGAMESSMNNMRARAVPRVIRGIRAGWEEVKRDIDFARTHNDPPESAHEMSYRILMPTGVEIQKINNLKLKRFAMELDRLASVVGSVDSASSQGHVDLADFALIDEQVATVDDVLDMWFGTGADAGNTGVLVEPNIHLGNVKPNVAESYAQVKEPSADPSVTLRPDAPDTQVGN